MTAVLYRLLPFRAAGWRSLARGRPAALAVLFACLVASPSTAAGEKALETAKSIEARLDLRLGYAMIGPTGEMQHGYRADERFAMNSTFKALACAAALNRGDQVLDMRVTVRKGDILPHSPVTETRIGSTIAIRALCEITLRTSDNAAANLVLKAIDGPEALTDFLRAKGDDVTRLDRFEPELNEAKPGDPRDTTTPRAMASTIRHLTLGSGLSPAASRQLDAWMQANAVADGLLRKVLPKGWPIADRSGAGGFGSRGIVALIRPDTGDPVVVAIYMTGKAHPLKVRDAAIAELGDAIFADLAR
ncbi:class A beta-lactamase [Peteryoungia ipomoeae]|nr:class A beta-lactamase [Peteryoungia ipomoeae]